jgi:hypothetical protein
LGPRKTAVLRHGGPSRERAAKAQGKKPRVISPLALEAVRRINALFEIERSINGHSAERRKSVRQELSASLVADLQAWMREQRAKHSRGNEVVKTMDYMLKRWDEPGEGCPSGNVECASTIEDSIVRSARRLSSFRLGPKSTSF